MLRAIYANRHFPGSGITFRVLPVIVLSGDPEQCAAKVHKYDPTVPVVRKQTTDDHLFRDLSRAWTELRDRLLDSAVRAGASVERGPTGWMAEHAEGFDTPEFHGPADHIAATLDRLDRLASEFSMGAARRAAS